MTKVSNHMDIEPEAPSDGHLVRETLAGRRDSFDLLIKRYQRQAMAVSIRLLNNPHDAAEVTQDAFLKAFNSLKTLEKPDAFGGWLMRIVNNLSLNYRRARKTRSQLPLDDLLGPIEAGEDAGSEWMSKTAQPLRTLESRELGARLKEALLELPEKQRQAIMLFTMEDMPQKEIAEQLDCSVEAVKWYVFQGRKKLKELLKGYL
jgi:RNA polymerase sigma-70 factor (ECF subfamily)